MKKQFKDLVVQNLKMFIDIFIETPTKVSFSQEDLLRKFVKQKILQKRALTLQEELNEQKKLVAALKKKGELYEMAVLSLKHKIKALKWDQKNAIERINKSYMAQRENTVAEVEHRI